MGDKPSKSKAPAPEAPKGGISQEAPTPDDDSVPIVVEHHDIIPVMRPPSPGTINRNINRIGTDAADLKKRQATITKDIMMRNGNFGPAEANLLAKMFMEYFSKTDNYLQAYQRFHREIQVFSIHGDTKQKKMAQLLLDIHSDEVKRYGNIAYGSDNPSTGQPSRNL